MWREEGGGGTTRQEKSGGRSLLTPARTDYPRRVSSVPGGGGPPRRGGGPTRSPQAPALVLTPLGALQGSEVQIVTLGNSLRGREASLRTPSHRVQFCLQNSKTGLDVT